MNILTAYLERLALAAVFAVQSTNFSAVSVGTLSVSVFAGEGSVLPAHLVIREDAVDRTPPSNKRILLVETDPYRVQPPRGRIDLQLEVGFHDVCVMADGFIPECQKVRIRERQATERTFRLKLDPEVARTGDTVR